MEMVQSEQQKEKWLKKNEQSPEDLSDNNRCSNTHVIKVPEWEKEYVAEILFEEIMTGNLPGLAKNTTLQTEEAAWTWSRQTQRNACPRRTNHNHTAEM